MCRPGIDASDVSLQEPSSSGHSPACSRSERCPSAWGKGGPRARTWSTDHVRLSVGPLVLLLQVLPTPWSSVPQALPSAGGSPCNPVRRLRGVSVSLHMVLSAPVRDPSAVTRAPRPLPRLKATRPPGGLFPCPVPSARMQPLPPQQRFCAFPGLPSLPTGPAPPPGMAPARSVLSPALMGAASGARLPLAVTSPFPGAVSKGQEAAVRHQASHPCVSSSSPWWLSWPRLCRQHPNSQGDPLLPQPLDEVDVQPRGTAPRPMTRSRCPPCHPWAGGRRACVARRSWFIAPGSAHSHRRAARRQQRGGADSAGAGPPGAHQRAPVTASPRPAPLASVLPAPLTRTPF